MWRNGIYPYAHYHSMIHEAMGLARGRATVRFGGENGQDIEIVAGDVVILPAGTGHQFAEPEPGAGRHRRLSADRQIRSVPRQQAGARQGAHLDFESAAARHRSGVRIRGAADRVVAGMISGWLAFWDNSHSIYVDARHKDVHYRLIAQEIAALVPSPQARVLDYGSRRGAARRSRRRGGRRTPAVRRRAERARRSCRALCRQSRKSACVAPEDVERLPEHSLDLIVLHSVAQYLTAAETDALFALFQRLLKTDGLLVVSDVIPPHVTASTDAWTLLRFGAANGFLIAALGGLVRTLAFRLLAPALALRPDPLRRSRHDRKTRRRGLCGAAQAGQYRAQSGAHGVHGAAARTINDREESRGTNSRSRNAQAAAISFLVSKLSSISTLLGSNTL